MTSVSITFAVWTRAWLDGQASPDDVVDALHEWAPMHVVHAGDQVTAGRTGVPWPAPQDSGVISLLGAVRRTIGNDPGALSVFLPAPGDVAGLPRGTAFSTAAIEQGEGILARGTEPGAPMTGLVPVVEGPDVLRWTVFSVDWVPTVAPLTTMSLGEVEYSLRSAVRNAADALVTFGSASSAGGVQARALVQDALFERTRHRMPDDVPERAKRVLDTAAQIDAIIEVGEELGAFASATLADAHTVETLIAPLRSLARTARLVATQAILERARR